MSYRPSQRNFRGSAPTQGSYGGSPPRSQPASSPIEPVHSEPQAEEYNAASQYYSDAVLRSEGISQSSVAPRSMAPIATSYPGTTYDEASISSPSPSMLPIDNTPRSAPSTEGTIERSFSKLGIDEGNASSRGGTNQRTGSGKSSQGGRKQNGMFGILKKFIPGSHGREIPPKAAFAETFRLNGSPTDIDVDKVDVDDVIIAVMGPTGSGKSSFIKKITGSPTTVVSSNLKSCTSEIQAVKLSGPNPGDLSLVFIDTPGFNDTTKSDLEILKMISDWLENTYARKIKLAGILYLHPISQNRMAGSLLNNLVMFESLCGKRSLGSVIFVTTMWSEVDEEVGAARERELKDTFLRRMRKSGSQVFRYENTDESAWDIVDHFVDFRFATLLQEEMVDLKKQLHQTEAGRMLYSNLEELAKRQESTSKAIREQLEFSSDGGGGGGGNGMNMVILEALQREYDSLRIEIARTVADMQQLEDKSVAQRIMRMLWLPRGVRAWKPNDFRPS